MFLLHTSAHECSNDLFVLFFVLMLVSLWLASCLHIQNVNPEPTHFLSPPPPHTHTHTHTHPHIDDRAPNKTKKETTKTNKKNGELFSSSFDLIIYLCVIEDFWFVQIWILRGVGQGVKGHIGSYLCCLFWRSAPLTHSS